MQTTLRTSADLKGTGLHTGQRARLRMQPAPPHSGIWLRRTDVVGVDRMIPARYDHVPEGRLCTRLRNDDGVEVMTVEHLMAALVGCGVSNALVEIDGPEVPILDGSALPFVRAILGAGLQAQAAPVHVWQIREAITVTHGDASATLRPADGLEIAFDIAFPDAAIGAQRREATLANGTFVRTLCDSRTFCREADVAAMRAAGLALGGTYDNAVVVRGADVLSPGGLRHPDEAVRHKMLDALGDLALAGHPILGRFEGVLSGHMLTNRLLRALFATPGAATLGPCSPAQERLLPGAGLRAADIAQVA